MLGEDGRGGGVVVEGEGDGEEARSVNTGEQKLRRGVELSVMEERRKRERWSGRGREETVIG